MNHSNFTDYLHQFQQELHSVMTEYPELETENRLEGLKREHLDKLLSQVPLSVFIPTEHGGRGDIPAQCLALLETTAYESIAVALLLGINGSLFLEPIFKYGQESAKRRVFDRFLNHKATGGLMITEPEFGTDALSMQTSYQESDMGFSVKGTKHWGGLTGLADFWLITARKTKEESKLARDIDLFIVEKQQPGQSINVTEYYPKLGLFLIPYGLNQIDCQLPADARLVPNTSGLKLMMDLLHRSRLRLSGIGIGFIKRLLDEALEHTRHRYVGGKNLMSYDQVQQRLTQMQAWYTISSAIVLYATRVSDINNDLTGFGLQANASKAILTDMMQDSAQSLLQLVGAKGYRRDHFAGRAVADSRPFQIFEGSNDVMYSQIADLLLKEMKKVKTFNLYDFFSRFDLTSEIAPRFKDLLHQTLDSEMPQRIRVVLGKLTARLVTTAFTLDLLNAGFREDLVENAIAVVRQLMAELVASLNQTGITSVIEDYQSGGDWKALALNTLI